MKIQSANRGVWFERLIELANHQYQLKNWGIIQKVPTPWKVIRRGAAIVNAFPEKKSTVDFIGVAKGKAVAFDAKSTRETTRFPLSNLEEHQMDFLRNWQEQGGISFFLVEFAVHGDIHYVPFEAMENYWKSAKKGGRKSIPHADFASFPKVESKDGLFLHYLEHLG